jgi:large subunit ribosomal protein L21
MYAVIRTGGKQYRVKEGDVIRVSKLAGEVGGTVTLDDVLMLGEGKGAQVGKPRVKGASVQAEIIRHGRDRKIRIYTYKRRKGSKRTLGHRQDFTELKITGVNPGA